MFIMGFFFLFFLQVETVAQFGVVFLLFALGLEFSMTKVRLFCLLSSYLCVFIVIYVLLLYKIHHFIGLV